MSEFTGTFDPLAQAIASALMSMVAMMYLQIGYGTVYRAMPDMVACGQAKKVPSTEGVTRYAHQYQSCEHRYVVCQDCGE